MGLVDELQGSKICIDTAPFIHFIENDPKYLSITIMVRQPQTKAQK
jgi:hypothetical protein